MERYNKIAKEKGLPLMQPLTLIIDEYFELKGNVGDIETSTEMAENLYGQMQLVSSSKKSLNDVLMNIVDTGRKAGVRLILADQTMSRIHKDIRDNTGTKYITKTNEDDRNNLHGVDVKNVTDDNNPFYNKEKGEVSRIRNNQIKKFKIKDVYK
jgi:hypothetical protein